MDDIVGTRVLLLVNNNTNTASVTTTSGHADVTCLEGNMINNLLVAEIDANSVVDCNLGIGEAESSTVVCHAVGDALGTKSNTGDFTKLELKKKDD